MRVNHGSSAEQQTAKVEKEPNKNRSREAGLLDAFSSCLYAALLGGQRISAYHNRPWIGLRIVEEEVVRPGRGKKEES